MRRKADLLRRILLLLPFLLHFDMVAPATMEFTPLEKDRYWQYTTSNYWWRIYPLSHEECNNCGDLKLNPLCSTDLGPVPPANKSSIPDEGKVCIRFHTKHPPNNPFKHPRKIPSHIP